MSKVAVIGGGLAGFSAALAAAAEGAEVTLIAKAPGATSLYAGGMEIAPELGVLAQLAHHPFHRLGMDEARLGAELEEACAWLTAALARAGLPLRGGLRERGVYADICGVPHEANFVPEAVAPGELGALRGKRVVVVGVPSVSEYDAESTAAALRELAGIEATAEELPIEDLGPGASITDLFGRPAPEPHVRAQAIAYPPGFIGLPANGFELLAAAPSPHGWRLQQALQRALAATSVKVVTGEATGFHVEGGRLRAAAVGADQVTADAFVMATGRYLGGGLRKGRAVTEPLAGLQVFFDGRPAPEQAVALHHLEYLSPEPAFRAGLLTDAQLRPLDAAGKPHFDNLRAAGSLLGGRDYADGFGFGVPLLTGRLAGRWSARS
ncbi:MAG TPA: FAD-binding protein [Candidatus Dormibacteraeota bacterium]